MENTNKESNNKFKPDTKTIIIILLFLVIAGIVGYLLTKDANIMNKRLANNSNTVVSKIEENNIVNNTATNNESNTNSTVSDNKNSTTINKIGTTTIPTINLDEPVSKDDKYEVTLKSSRFGKIINPPNTSGYYRYYEASDGHQYLEITYDYKNLSGYDVRADKTASIKIKYNDKYEYTGFSIIEDSDGDFTYSNITSIPALSTGKMHYLIEVPDEVANDENSIVATISCEQNKYQIKLR